MAIRQIPKPDGRPDFEKLASDYCAAVQPEALARLAVALGVSAEHLRWLCIGWCEERQAWSFPMTNAAGETLGIRLRLLGGKKLSVRGGQEGLFIPAYWSLGATDGSLLVCEGPTDCAALLDLQLDAVGRPSCRGGVKLLVELVRAQRPAAVVIVADGDAPGRRGAETLAVALAAHCRDVRVITPPAPFKDARAWKQAGATHADVLAAIERAPVRKLSVSTRIRRKAGKAHGR